MTSGAGSLTEANSGRYWSNTDIRQEVLLRTSSLHSRGMKPGDRVLIHFGNRLEFFAELLAVWRLGGCAIPVDSRLTPFEVAKLIETAAPRFSIIDDDTDPETVKSVDDSQLIAVSRKFRFQDLPSLDPNFPRLDDDALILFTSGSTGTPKGVVHTHRSLGARWTTLRQKLGLNAYRRTLCVLPTHFGHGLICNCLFPWLYGCDLIIAPPFKPETLMKLGDLIDEQQVSFMSSVPSVWNLALRTAKPPKLGSLRRIHIGSAPLSENLWKRVQQWSGIDDVFNAYGITETGSWVAGTTGGKVKPQSGLVGEPWGATFKIMKNNDGDPFEDNEECKAEETGMVWLSTPALMKGYFNRPDLTDEVVQGGWFKTGDIGLLDKQGQLLLKGRERDEINKGGMKVFPADIDEVVEQFSGTQDVCSFGFEDAFYGENVGLALVLNDQDSQTIRDLHAWISQRLAVHKHPERWYVLDQIPRTSRGKINRETVMNECMEREPLNVRQLLRDKPG
jgi:acyl-CoA synthetase (AMP-forming)/AMP-acid ligase II